VTSDGKEFFGSSLLLAARTYLPDLTGRWPLMASPWSAHLLCWKPVSRYFAGSAHWGMIASNGPFTVQKTLLSETGAQKNISKKSM
jgi:hypothetical protein